MSRLFHIVSRPDWDGALAAGQYLPASLQSEGFVHFSFADQVAGTANLRFADASDLCVVEVDADLLPVPVIVEDSYGSGTAFPHVYSAIPTSAAVAIHDLARDANGVFAFNPDVAGDCASPDR